MSTKVTDVKVYPANGAGTLKANANVTLNEDFVIKLRVCDAGDGPFVAMPTGPKYQKDGKDVYPEVCFPVTKECREEIHTAVLNKYNEMLAES